MLIRTVIMERVAMVAEQQGKHLPPLTDDLRLLNSVLILSALQSSLRIWTTNSGSTPCRRTSKSTFR